MSSTMSRSISAQPSEERFSLTEHIWKPYPPDIIALMRDNRDTMRIIIADFITQKNRQIKVFTKKKNFTKNCLKIGRKMLREDPTLVEANMAITIEEGESQCETGTFRYLGLKPYLESTKQNLLEFKMCVTIFNHLDKQNKDKAREELTKLKLLFGEKLEQQMENNLGYRMLSAADESKVTYRGKGDNEQNILKMSEVLQERCNMFENIFAIMMD